MTTLLTTQLVERMKTLQPSHLELLDDSAKHIGHAGAAGGAGHFFVKIVSEQFRGANRLQRHRMVYDLVSDLMPHPVHALQIDARTPEESSLIH